MACFPKGNLQGSLEWGAARFCANLQGLLSKDMVESLYDFLVSTGNDRKLKKIARTLPESTHISRELHMGRGIRSGGMEYNWMNRCLELQEINSPREMREL